LYTGKCVSLREVTFNRLVFSSSSSSSTRIEDEEEVDDEDETKIASHWFASESFS
jgi:hypothetical protein